MTVFVQLTEEQRKLASDNIRCVTWIVNRWRRRWPDQEWDELMADGFVGLTLAARRFDGRDVTFMAFAKRWIFGEVEKGVLRREGRDHTSRRDRTSCRFPTRQLQSLETELAPGFMLGDLVAGDEDPATDAAETVDAVRILEALSPAGASVLACELGLETQQQRADALNLGAKGVAYRQRGLRRELEAAR